MVPRQGHVENHGCINAGRLYVVRGEADNALRKAGKALG
jgi:hypothetical protein